MHPNIVQQVIVKILHAALSQLFVEDAFLAFGRLEHARRQLGSQEEGIAWMPLYQGLARKLLAFVGVVGQSGVKIGEAPLKKGVHHHLQLRHIDGGLIVRVQQWKPHTAKTKLFAHMNFPFGASGFCPCSLPVVAAFARRALERADGRGRRTAGP